MSQRDTGLVRDAVMKPRLFGLVFFLVVGLQALICVAFES